MLSLIIRLFALRPLLAATILGIPLMTLVLLGLATAVFLKLLLFVILPVIGIVWLVRRARKPDVQSM
jgi:type IV secretory pathway VirB3-like protein